MINTMTKSNLKMKGFILQVIVHNPSLGEVGAETQAGSWSKDHGGAMLTALFPLACSFSLKKSRPTCPWIINSELAGPSHINQQSREYLTDKFTGQSDKDYTSNENSFSWYVCFYHIGKKKTNPMIPFIRINMYLKCTRITSDV